MVLPLRIELRTSPLPRECSTTELRQRRKVHGYPIPMRRETATGGPAPQGFGLPRPGAGLSDRAMADDRKPVDRDSARAAQTERLARALRENLKRRKAQARGRTQDTPAKRSGEHKRQD